MLISRLTCKTMGMGSWGRVGCEDGGGTRTDLVRVVWMVYHCECNRIRGLDKVSSEVEDVKRQGKGIFLVVLMLPTVASSLVVCCGSEPSPLFCFFLFSGGIG